MLELRDISNYWMTLEIFLFNIVGNFGNFNLIWCTIRKKEMRTKPGILLAINAVYQSICLISCFINIAVILSGKPIERSRCYPIVMPYTIAISQQAPMAFVIALDLLIALIFPIRYRSISTLPYVALLCLPGWIYSLFFMIYGWIMMNDDLVHLCNVVVGLEPSVSSLWTFSNVVVNVAVLVVYLCIFLTLKCRYSDNPAAYNEHRRVVRRLTVIVIVFIFSWFLALLGANIFIILNIDPKILPYLQSNMIFFGCICFSQNFYVCIWRSLDYRRAFMEQLDILRCRNSSKRTIAIGASTADRKTGAGWVQ